MPTVYLIAGPNGAGKTTFATEFLPAFVHCREFVNADLIAAGLSPFAPETQAIRAGRLLLTRIKECTNDRRDFAFETTPAGRGYLRLVADLKRSGYRVVLYFLWCPAPKPPWIGSPAGSGREATTSPRHSSAAVSRPASAISSNYTPLK